MPIALKPLQSIFFALALVSVGCFAQTGSRAMSAAGSVSAPDSATAVSPEMARRIEVLIRSKSDIPYNYVFQIGRMSSSEVPGYNSVTVEFSVDGKTSKPLPFLISKDGKTLAQMMKFDIGSDPKSKVSGADRPARGGKVDAPVLIVVFDDLECPFCSKMNSQLFPAVLDRYKDQVRVVYRDYPLVEIHPWAMRAAIDTNCVGAQSSSGYWNLIDYIHNHADEIGGKEKTVAKANEMLDELARAEGKKQTVDEAKLTACLTKQDPAVIKQSMKEAEAIGVNATPALFINGEKIEGAQPMEYVYRMIDGALIAAGKTPPAAPAQVGTNPATGTSAQSQNKPGNE